MTPNLNVCRHVLRSGEKHNTDCSHLKNTVEALLWFGAALLPTSVGDLVKIDKITIAEKYKYQILSTMPLCNTIWKASQWQRLYFQA